MLVRDDGSRNSITNPAHRYNFHPEKIDITKHASKVITLGSLFRAPFDDPEIIKEVVTAAKQHGLITVADTKLPNFRVLQLKDLSDSLPLIDYITPNEDEARYYTGKEAPEEMAEAFLDHGVKNVILKLGRNGCYFRNRKESFFLPAYDVRAIDSTGAGDNFIAGFVSEILQGSTVLEALVFANACGAICTTAAGAGTALVDRAQVMAFIDAKEMEQTQKTARSSASEDRVGIAREDL
jgi:sugar/nucleoside kinase (ribokinase family)